jgi:hypothetical protein
MPRYQLEKHPKKKGPCPACGEKGVFRYYQNEEGERLDEQYGICDRAAKCGHDHRPSGELFKSDHQEPGQAEIVVIRPPEAKTIDLLEKTKLHSSNFHRWAEDVMGVSAEHLERWAVASDGDRTAYLHFDQSGNLTNVKWFRYTPEGRRDKQFEPHALRQPAPKERCRFQFCFYGEHLLRTDDPTRPICMVESEKTAVIASFFYPQFDWLACGSANGITDAKIAVLHNRPVWWLCDADGNVPAFKDGKPVLVNGKPKMTEGGRRNSSLRKLKAYEMEHAIIDLFPEKTDGYDLGDALRDGLRPELAPPPAPEPAPVEPKAQLPANREDWSVQWRERWHKATKFIEEFERREIDLTENAGDWENVVASLATFGEHGRKLVHRLAWPSAGYTKKDTDAAFDAAMQLGACTSPTKFFQIATHFNISLKELRDKNEVKERIMDGLPEGVNAEDYFKHGFYEMDNCYYSIKDGSARMVCGFTIKVLYLVKSKDNPKRIVELKNQWGYTTTLDLPTDAFVSVGAFKKYVEGAGNFVFEGNDIDLTRLKKKLFREERVTQEITTLGWHERGQFYAFANGIYNAKWTETDEYGIVEHGGHNYFLPFLSGISADDHESYLNEKKFVHKPIASPMHFAEWASLLKRTYGTNGCIGLCFYVAALFRDHIFEAQNAFPLLFSFGKRESGKSKFTDSFKPLFGKPQDSISLGNRSSQIGMTRTQARFCNSLVVLEEYKNSIDPHLVEMLKGLWDGIGRTTGVKSNDNQVKVTKPRSATIVSGQEMPTIDNALFTRVILLEFLAQGRDYAAYDELKRREKEGLTNITVEVLMHRPAIVETYGYCFNMVLIYLKDALAGAGIEDRMLQNMAQILAPTLHLLDAGLLKFPFTRDELLAMALQLIRRQHQQIHEATDSQRFWDIFVGLATHKPFPLVVEGVDYMFQAGNLFIRLGNVHPHYMKEHRSQYNVPGLDKVSMEYYLKNDGSFVGKKNIRFEIPAAQNNGLPGIKGKATSAYGFRFKDLGIDLHQSQMDAVLEDDEASAE